jgi:glycosyltransferase involved in cell wall biosynthesis
VVLSGFGQDEQSTIMSLADHHRVRDQVHPLGYLTVEEIAYLYRRAEMLVFPSLFEGFGIPLVEAMTVGCPVVASNVTSLPEIGGDAAEYFDPTSPAAAAAAIERVLEDERWRETLRMRGFERARAFSPAATADRHLAVFREAARAYSRRTFYWRRWVTAYAHRARLEWRWRAYHRRSAMDWVKAGRQWIHDPAG